MDMITVDVTGLDVSPGDEVVLLGRQGDERWQTIDAREMAATIGTIPWEVVCRLGHDRAQYDRQISRRNSDPEAQIRRRWMARAEIFAY